MTLSTSRKPGRYQAIFSPVFTVLLLLLMLQGLNTLWPVLAYDRVAIAQWQVWRLVTGHLVHNNLAHLLLNAAAWVFAGLLWYRVKQGRMLGIILALSLLTGLLMYVLTPGLGYYVGFSAVLHGLFFLGGINDIRRGLYAGYLICAALIAKVFWQWQYPESTADTATTIGLPVAVDAHALGLLAAALMALAARFVRSGLDRQGQDPQA